MTAVLLACKTQTTTRKSDPFSCNVMSSHHSQLLTCTYLPMGIYFYFLCLSLSPDINLDVNLEDDHLIPFMKYSSTTSCFHCRLFFFVCLSFFSCISNLYISMFKSHYLHITLINLSMLPPARPHNTDNDSNDNNNAKVYISNINKNVPINFYLD